MGRSEGYGFRTGELIQLVWWVTETFSVRMREAEGMGGVCFTSRQVDDPPGSPIFSIRPNYDEEQKRWRIPDEREFAHHLSVINARDMNEARRLILESRWQPRLLRVFVSDLHDPDAFQRPPGAPPWRDDNYRIYTTALADAARWVERALRVQLHVRRGGDEYATTPGERRPVQISLFEPAEGAPYLNLGVSDLDDGVEPLRAVFASCPWPVTHKSTSITPHDTNDPFAAE